MTFEANKFYFLHDQYFVDFPDPYLKSNKDAKRPFYFCTKCVKTGLIWMIPLSSRPEKVQLAHQKEREGKKDVFHLTYLGGKEGVMIICDMFPITEEYLKSEYTISGIPVQYKDSTEIKKIHQKAMKVLGLIRRGIKLVPTAPDVLAIEKHLIAGTTMRATKEA